MLIVEDDPDARELVKRYVSDVHDGKLRVANNGASALAMLAHHLPDLICVSSISAMPPSTASLSSRATIRDDPSSALICRDRRDGGSAFDSDRSERCSWAARSRCSRRGRRWRRISRASCGASPRRSTPFLAPGRRRLRHRVRSCACCRAGALLRPPAPRHRARTAPTRATAGEGRPRQSLDLDLVPPHAAYHRGRG